MKYIKKNISLTSLKMEVQQGPVSIFQALYYMYRIWHKAIFVLDDCLTWMQLLEALMLRLSRHLSIYRWMITSVTG